MAAFHDRVYYIICSRSLSLLSLPLLPQSFPSPPPLYFHGPQEGKMAGIEDGTKQGVECPPVSMNQPAALSCLL
jgi:hypothetical protein